MPSTANVPTFDKRGVVSSEYKGTTDSQCIVVVDEARRSRDVYVSPLLSVAEGYPLNIVLAPEVSLREAPSHLFFFVPGNPGVAGAYLPWMYHMCDRLGPKALIVFSGHLGHLKTATLDEEFTCEQNVEHQHQQLCRILKALMPYRTSLSVTLAGHSAGAYFVTHGAHRTYATVPDVMTLPCRIVLYCGTLIQFGNIGRLRAMVAAAPSGISLIKRIKGSKWLEKRIAGNAFFQGVLDEFDDSFIQQMSHLTRDELEHLPTDVEEQIVILREMKMPVFFLLAAKDSYVPKAVQRKYLEEFGAKHVYIAREWWHAFALHSESFVEASDITEAIIREGAIPEVWQRKMREDLDGFRIENVTYACQMAMAGAIVQIASLPSNLRGLMCRRTKIS